MSVIELKSEKDFLIYSYKLAKGSPDPSTQNGAVIVRDGEILGTGCNTFPRGVEPLPERLSKIDDEKYFWLEHAERMAIYAAARVGNKLLGATMYCPFFACADCGRAIVETGIKYIVGHKIPSALAAHPAWEKTIKKALKMFDEAGVKYSYYEGRLGGIEVLRNGNILTP